MTLLLDSFWRAVAYCLHPRVIALSLLPLGLLVALSFWLGYLYWASALAAVTAWLDASVVFSTLWGWLGPLGAGELRHGLAPVLPGFAPRTSTHEEARLQAVDLL